MEFKLNDYEPKEVIRIIREATDLSQEKFGKAIGKKSREWSKKIERGERGIGFDDFMRIANTFDIEITAKMRDRVKIDKKK